MVVPAFHRATLVPNSHGSTTGSRRTAGRLGFGRLGFFGLIRCGQRTSALNTTQSQPGLRALFGRTRPHKTALASTAPQRGIDEPCTNQAARVRTVRDLPPPPPPPTAAPARRRHAARALPPTPAMHQHAVALLACVTFFLTVRMETSCGNRQFLTFS